MIDVLLSRLNQGNEPTGPLVDRALGETAMRRVGVEAIEIGISGHPSADKQISSLLREARVLGSKERRLVSDTVYGAVRDWKTLCCLLEMGGLPEASPAALWAAQLLVSQGASPALAVQETGLDCFQPSADALKSLRTWYETNTPTASETIATLASLPQWLASRLVTQYGDNEAANIAAALCQRAPTTLRVNRAKVQREVLADLLLEAEVQTTQGTLTEDSLHVMNRANLRGLDVFREGLFEIQDEGSQLVSELVEPSQGGLTVDYCCGAGGKSLAIAHRLPRRSRIVGLDIRESAIREARRRTKRAGCTRSEFHLIEAQGPLPIEGQSAHRVLVDTPCTGTGRFRRQPASRWSLREDQLTDLVQTQNRILERAATLVRPKGRLIYATCSLLTEENEGIVTSFLQKNPTWKLLPVKEVLGRRRARKAGDGTTLQTRPDLHGTDGFFAAILVRQDLAEASDN
ncbi:MAG: RsmB/NOP family class I SAM-dependent RNA methyltransferase [Myxococcota bacterium]|nr:RsmB/NOP family class I SAM-dependent RNA methyltransferase [Myxococcota bacterium]